jgi:hypothetical protein
VEFDALLTSDEWAADRQLKSEYYHFTVCHKRNFVESDPGAHTQRIESMWRACKSWLRTMNYRFPANRDAYVKEWCWRYHHGRDWLPIWHDIFN